MTKKYSFDTAKDVSTVGSMTKQWYQIESKGVSISIARHICIFLKWLGKQYGITRGCISTLLAQCTNMERHSRPTYAFDTQTSESGRNSLPNRLIINTSAHWQLQSIALLLECLIFHCSVFNCHVNSCPVLFLKNSNGWKFNKDILGLYSYITPQKNLQSPFWCCFFLPHKSCCSIDFFAPSSPFVWSITS